MRADPRGRGARVVREPALGWIDWLPLGVFSVLAVALFSGSWAEPSRALVGVPADNVLSVWMLAWAAHALAGGHSLFYSYLIGAPGGVNLLSSTAITLAGLVLSPVTWLFGPVVAYDALASGALALSGWCAYLCLRRCARGRVGPMAGGLVYGFSPALVAQSYGHVQITLAFLVPLMVILVDEAVVRRRPPPVAVGVGLGLVLVAQFLLSAEVLTTEAMMGVVLVAVLALLHPREVRERVPVALMVGGTAALVFVLVAGWPLYLEVAGAGHTVGGSIRGLHTYVTDLANLVLPTGVQALGPAGVAKHFAAGLVESNGYLGVPLLVVVGWGFWRCRRVPAVQVAGLVGLIALILSLGPNLEVGGRVTGVPLPWALLEHLPVLRDVLPSRLSVYTDLAVAVLLAVWVGEVEAQMPLRGAHSAGWLGGRGGWGATHAAGGAGGPGRAAGGLGGPGRAAGGLGGPGRAGAVPLLRHEALGAGVGLLLIGVTLFPAVPFPSYRPAVPAFFRSAGASVAIPTGSVAVVLPLNSSSSLLWQALTGMRFSMPENHIGTGPHPPSSLGPMAGALLKAQASGVLPAASQLSRLRAGLVRSCATSVVAGPMAHQGAVVKLVSLVSKRTPRLLGGVYLWRIADRCTHG